MGDEDVVQEEVLPLEPLITQVTGVPPTLPLVRHTKVRPPAVSLHYLTHLATLVHRRPVHLDPEYFPSLELCVLTSQYLMKVPSEMPIMSPVTN